MCDLGCGPRVTYEAVSYEYRECIKTILPIILMGIKVRNITLTLFLEAQVYETIIIIETTLFFLQIIA